MFWVVGGAAGAGIRQADALDTGASASDGKRGRARDHGRRL